ncbi:hypothetical protein VIGAN_11158500 [Vigna angularis var. angularis]|uniref:Uncharacterized protein n=1 Tax=Vigna angularis var. angularis TaxID=157739 RepID=A0A0S3TA89_PHAAN|nr:hypothetical protein VIGAN_11158500 [Vigna angularis var. angularis]
MIVELLEVLSASREDLRLGREDERNEDDGLCWLGEDDQGVVYHEGMKMMGCCEVLVVVLEMMMLERVSVPRNGRRPPPDEGGAGWFKLTSKAKCR